MASIFSRIYKGEIPGHIVAKSEDYFAILDINPLALGHVLVIPVKETDYLFDIEDADLSSYIRFTKRVANAIKEVVPCKRIGMAVIGLEVSHAHIHLVPMNEVGDINFSRTKLNPTSSELIDIAEKISSAFI